MPEHHGCIIIGAGVIGCSIAYHLARLGEKGICIVEREATPGCGSTGKANGGIRAQFTTGINVRLSLKSMEILEDLAPEIGEPPVYIKAGYLFMTADEKRLAAMGRAVQFQRSLGVSVDLLDGDDVRKMAPYVYNEDIVGGTFGPRDGFVDPGLLTNWFYSAARKMGVEARFGTEVTGIERLPSGGFSVTTADGSMATANLVNAAGPYAAGIAGMLGVRLPVEPVRRHQVITGPCRDLPALIPMTIDADTGVLIRREGDRILITYSNPDEPPGFNETFDPDFIVRFAEPLLHRFPLAADAGFDFKRSWAGLYAVSPDHCAILGEAPGVEGFYLANGYSGHGVMHSPAVGLCLAELIARGKYESVDVSALSLARFKKGEQIRESTVL